MAALTKRKIEYLLKALAHKLEERKITGELYLVGGAVMCLVFETRPATKDIDAFFHPAKSLRESIVALAAEEDLPDDWVNDAVKGFLSEKGVFSPYRDFGSLKIFTPHPEYLFAMKCLAMRIGPEFSDEEDVRYLLRYLNIISYDEALKIITQYYAIERFPQKSFFALEEMINRISSSNS